MKIVLTISLFLNIALTNYALADNETCSQQGILTAKDCPGDGLEREELRLYEMVNQYRLQNGLYPLPLSSSLTRVANRHVRDLAENIGYLTPSWSDCRYNDNDPSTWNCMWQAPQRLNMAYTTPGHEIAAANGYKIFAITALQQWQQNSAYNAVILNQYQWITPWQAMGVGIYQRYAVLWLGRAPDPQTVSQLPLLGLAQALDINNQFVETSTTFSGGVAVGTGAFENRVAVNRTDTLAAEGIIAVDPKHVGEKADIVVYVWVKLPEVGDTKLFMLTAEGKPQPWDNEVIHLLPFQQNVTLKPIQPLKLYTGQLDLSAIVQVYFGYRLSPNTKQMLLVVNNQPIDLQIK
jgi:hypothetical protein